ncbi:MerR family transcriptional regulator [uncultured Acetobacteroides sp.]|jgi:DNA-binding transcriptional MerR regulator|uniref:MerR family transcriptional regulator n=1 Tax=uncultured Acetobacteroides sp. TaxID=1760811 RepID=UPI0029F4CFEB|nr:MerR family transcriptional regulator [uncultured Acetobacteroides sp.]
MPYKEKKVEKLFYSIGEVSEMLGVNPSLIRFWEKNFTIIKPQKNKKGNRLFTVKDIETLKLIYHLVKEKGMTLEGAQKRLKDNKEGEDRSFEVIDRLTKIKEMLLDVSSRLP